MGGGGGGGGFCPDTFSYVAYFRTETLASSCSFTKNNFTFKLYLQRIIILV